MSPRPEDESGFLDRWSRLKRAGEDVSAPADPPAPEVAADEITAEAIAALPAPEEITLATDIRPFLRRGVPQALKNAALRRVWMLNPAIRDHKDLAVDYAWDWNTPGGVPGFSGEVAPKGVADLISKMNAGRLPEDDLAPADKTVPVAAPAEATVEAKADRVAQITDATPEVMPAPGGDLSENGEGEIAKATPAQRHGGARPI